MGEIVDIKKTEDLMHYDVSIKCPMCGEINTVRITGQQLFWLNQGERPAKVLDDKTPAERELFMTGICDKCWHEMFGEEE